MNFIKQFELSLDSARERRSKRWALLGEIYRRIRYIKIKADCNKLPTDLFQLAHHMKIIDIQEVPLGTRGRLLQEKDGMIIQVNNTLSPFDKLQTIAHELSHLVVEDKYLHLIPQRVERTKSSLSLPQRYIEELCDKAAAEILVPLQWLRDRIKGLSPSLNLIQTIALETNTSIDYIAARVCDDRLWWSCRFIWWRQKEERIYAIKSYPPQPTEFLIWMEPVNLQASLIVRCLSEQRYLEGRESLLIKDEQHDYRIQCLPLSQTDVISMLVYSTT